MTDALLERSLDISGGLGFVRLRMAVLGKTPFLASFGFYLFLLVTLTLIGGGTFAAVAKGPVALGHLCASLIMARLRPVKWGPRQAGACPATAAP